MKQTYFISDCHLGARYIVDPREHERRVVQFLDSIKQDAAALYLLGDVIDYWFEYRTVVPRGYVRFFGKLAELADSGVKITWLTGNHDVWLRDYLRDEIGLEVYHGHTIVEIDGEKVFISHGDDVGRQPLHYRITRNLFYNPVCQWLYAGIHPRWTSQVATGLSNKNRTSRVPSRENKSAEQAYTNLTAFASSHAKEHPEVAHYVFGHLHVARQTKLEGGSDVVVLGDWFKKNTYATLCNGVLTLRKWHDDDKK